MKPDIENRADIVKLVNTFYEKLLEDKELGPIFTQVAQINLTKHLPIIYDFWESVLFQVGKYKNNTLEVHLDLHHEHRLKSIHFDRWLALFNETVDAYFEGPKAKSAKDRALSIAQIMLMKINHLEQMRLRLNN